MDMNTASITRKQTSFRLNEDLLKRLQEEAKRHNRSLNNLVESVLMAFVAERPNKTTLAAMKEAESSDNLETLDLGNFRSFVDSL
jgi:predicted transcriptional regulator